ncbi:MAG TPA: DUF177 domain-containing protein [Methyloceanibacter sp.]|nr:DUF177 domain-containing protein [Methyloceanibacter sp.]
MKSDADRAIFSRPLKVDEIGDAASGEIAATEAEMTEIARLLDLIALDGLSFTYRIAQAGEGRLHMNGRLRAKVTQTCVLSLDPVAATLDVPVEVDFWPKRLLEAVEQSTEEPGSLLEWPEPIVNGTIDPGPVVYEMLATSLDPYPRREGASLEWSQQPPEADEGPRTGPFAALEALKRR